MTSKVTPKKIFNIDKKKSTNILPKIYTQNSANLIYIEHKLQIFSHSFDKINYIIYKNVFFVCVHNIYCIIFIS